MTSKEVVHAPLRTAIIGFGMVAAGNDEDLIMGKAYRYPSHASALVAHRGFSLEAVVDRSPEARALASGKWGVKAVFKSTTELKNEMEIDVAVLCTPPAGRREALAELPQLRGMFVEKPVGATMKEAGEAAALCREKAPLVQVNYWRRADRAFRDLARGQLSELIGEVQGGLAIYGNGLHNNGSHMVDFVRMLAGEITSVQAVGGAPACIAGPLDGDEQFAFNMVLESGAVIHAMPVAFASYRENGLDLWGTKGRLSILQDCRMILHYGKRPNRGLSETFEIASEEPQSLPSTFGTALYEMYENLSQAIHEGAELCSPLDEALCSERVVAAAQASQVDGAPVRVSSC